MQEKTDMTLYRMYSFVTETFVAAINSGDKSAIKYAYIAYKYTIKAVLPIFNSSKRIEKLKTALIKE